MNNINIKLLKATIIKKEEHESNVICYEFLSLGSYLRLTVVKNDEIDYFMTKEKINKVGSELTLIIPKERTLIIGLLNKENSHMILFKDKKEFLGLRTKHNYYDKELIDLGITREKVYAQLSEELSIEKTPKRLTLIGLSSCKNLLNYRFKYYDELGNERYTSITKENQLFSDPIIEESTIEAYVNDGVIEKIIVPKILKKEK